MPRTVEHIVACHEAAAALRAAGKAIWDRTIKIKSILERDRSNEAPEHAVAVAHKIAAKIRSSVPPKWLNYLDDAYDRDLDEVIDGLEAMTVDADALDELNGRLEEIYDWADRARVWIG